VLRSSGRFAAAGTDFARERATREILARLREGRPSEIRAASGAISPCALASRRVGPVQDPPRGSVVTGNSCGPMNSARMEADDFRVTPVEDWQEARPDGRVATRALSATFWRNRHSDGRRTSVDLLMLWARNRWLVPARARHRSSNRTADGLRRQATLMLGLVGGAG